MKKTTTKKIDYQCFKRLDEKTSYRKGAEGKSGLKYTVL